MVYSRGLTQVGQRRWLSPKMNPGKVKPTYPMAVPRASHSPGVELENPADRWFVNRPGISEPWELETSGLAPLCSW